MHRMFHVYPCLLIDVDSLVLKKITLEGIQLGVLQGDTWGYNFQGPLPRALLYRPLGRRLKAPKVRHLQ